LETEEFWFNVYQQTLFKLPFARDFITFSRYFRGLSLRQNTTKTSMFIFKRVSHLQEWVQKQKANGVEVGFVPTMGALHNGHLSLVEKSNSICGATIVSIFVNPKQFNELEDLVKYPRPIEKDLEMLYEGGVDVVFMPEVEDVYPPEIKSTLDFDLGPSASTMEGEFRPGHFSGMAEVVYRLLEITTPDALFMGQKDFQQYAIVRKLIAHFQLPVDLIMCPTIREENGLAMSSRNVRLSADRHEKASLIHKCLVDGKSAFESGESVEKIRQHMFDLLIKEGFNPEYLEVVNGYTLAPIKSIDEAEQVVACCAINVEDVRLIDNIIWKNS
jgi:pantoate--beta-alanine ligase